MHARTTIPEAALAAAAAALFALALFGPHVGPPPGYLGFVDARTWQGIAHAGDVLSNLAFAVAGAAGAIAMARLPARALTNMQRAMAALFFAGLVTTALCSAYFHWSPDEVRLAIDRSGMTVAFAGLLGLATATTVSERAAACIGLGTLLLAPWAIHAARGGELLPWAILQFGGMALLLSLALVRPRANALHVSWLAVIALYAAAKACELNDAAIFEATGHVISGHTLKHLVAALAAAPVIDALRWHNAPEPKGTPWAARLHMLRRSPE